METAMTADRIFLDETDARGESATSRKTTSGIRHDYVTFLFIPDIVGRHTMTCSVRRLMAVVTALFLISPLTTLAQGPKGKEFGFGIILGDPLGLTAKYWTNNENALVFGLGASYFGAPRIQVDYLWHFDAFQSQVVKMYAGPGLGFGFGREGYGVWYKRGKRDVFYYRDEGEFGIGVRAIVGINVIPKRTPLEIFLELGPNIGVAPGFGVALDAAIGVRFYP
ncbi:MAG TPA: hypothetical protein DIS79_09005 [Bacteroidetes bacterium]|nr:hypothetical protein [Bacteroidota bacterium]